MPPVLSRKRLRDDSPKPQPPPKRTTRKPAARRSKESVFQTLDTPPTANGTLLQTKAFLEEHDDESSLSESESSDEEFEDVPIGSAQKAKGKHKAQDAAESDGSEDEEWEDALGAHHHTKHADEPTPVISGDIEVTLSSTPNPSAFASKPDGKKGPSKIERQIRNVTHCVHVQSLMFHNLMRNSWIQDKQTQKILIENLTNGCWRELDKYWRDAGIPDGASRVVQADWKTLKALEREKKGKWKNSGEQGVKVFESPSTRKSLSNGDSAGASSKGKGKESVRTQRDWGATSDRLEPNTPNLSAGDPLLRLLRYLSAFWKSKYKITVPCLRKRGYLPPSTLEAEIGGWRVDPDNAELFGERLENLEAFREKARNCQGSRDVGQQLFTALLRGLGIEARMVASLQPVGFGWSQHEEGKPKNLDNLKSGAKDPKVNESSKTLSESRRKSRFRTAEGNRNEPISLIESDSSDLSSVISISSDEEEQARPVKQSPKVRKYGDDLPFPTYWTEAISHLTHTPVSVSILPRITIAGPTSPEKLPEFYCKGAGADKAKQVFAYVIAFSSDGTAKDVTTRYLPKHQWPGRTKGVRMPVEKIPIHNKRGKVKRWEEWDWFKSVMRPYARSLENRQPWDEVEDEGDLVPAQPAKPKDMDEEGGKETLQGYKNSTEYVLERHLKREEALIPGAEIVRYFTTGKGDTEKQEPVYRRKDVVTCKTVESWHKEGREIRKGEQPLKYVPMRAVTVTRKREIEEREREEGQKVKQGLYSKAQTDWIIPDPIVDGKIPRNAFGNIDIYAPTMIPKGAVHIPLKGTARVCRKLNIDYAEACTGFEFGKQRAVPVLTGVVVAAENEDLLIDAWEADEAEKIKKEQDKKEKLVLGLWKKFFVGLRIVDRMKREYGEEVELPQKSVQDTQSPLEEQKSEWETFQNHTDFEGGFLRDEPVASGGMSKTSIDQQYGDEDMGGGFFPASQEEVQHGELTIDHGEKKAEKITAVAETAYRTPISLQSALQQPVEEEIEDAEHNLEEEFINPSDEAPGPYSKKPSHNHTATGRKRSARNRSRTRGGKRISPTGKSVAQISGDESSPLSDISTESPQLDTDASNPTKSSRSQGRNKRQDTTPPPSTRKAPKRQAARKSDAEVKSHFFAHESDEETDLTDISPHKKGTATRGRGRAKGTGSSRGRSKGRGRG